MLLLQHEISLDPSQPSSAFRQSIYEKTGVPVDRQKVMIKAGQILKDDTDMASINAKQGQTFMVIGTAGPLPEAPKQPKTFLEDMTDSQLALAVRVPSRLLCLESFQLTICCSPADKRESRTHQPREHVLPQLHAASPARDSRTTGRARKVRARVQSDDRVVSLTYALRLQIRWKHGRCGRRSEPHRIASGSVPKPEWND